jgi:hypothetical protein
VTHPFTLFAIFVSTFPALAQDGFTFANAQQMMQKHCLACHQGKSATGGFNVARLASPQSIETEARAWRRVLLRVRDGEMPPPKAPAPAVKTRDSFVTWLDHTLKTAACADGITPTTAPVRRLNRDEYAATIRDLLNIHINAAATLPVDGAGGEGFDNAAETLFLSPVHAEKYLESAKAALAYAVADTRARRRFMIAEPGEMTTAEQAARKILEAFVPRAFRRPAAPGEIDRFYALYENAVQRGEPFDDSIVYALQGVLISPHFLFRIEEPNPTTEKRSLPDYALATRLSYFLWGSMPDDTLADLAAKGKLQDPAVLKEQMVRMLKDVKAREFPEHFVEQWLNTRELGRDIKPDAKLFPEYYDAETQAAIRYEPVLFFQELLTENLSLLNLIDSKFTFLTNKLARHYGIKIEGKVQPNQQPKRFDLPPNSHRGGLLGMSAILAVSSYPQRTSVVLRGKWILDSMLGTPAPPAPPAVPELETSDAAAPKTLRERMEKHRENAVCASCHNRIDPMGFALETYDVLGRWRTHDAGKPIDAKGELLDGTVFDGPDQLKQVLLERKELFLRNLGTKMLAYALGRGLTLEDHCVVDQIIEKLKQEDYAAQTMIREIIWSIPFRYQAGTPPAKPQPASKKQAPVRKETR